MLRFPEWYHQSRTYVGFLKYHFLPANLVKIVAICWNFFSCVIYFLPKVLGGIFLTRSLHGWLTSKINRKTCSRTNNEQLDSTGKLRTLFLSFHSCNLSAFGQEVAFNTPEIPDGNLLMEMQLDTQKIDSDGNATCMEMERFPKFPNKLPIYMLIPFISC